MDNYDAHVATWRQHLIEAARPPKPMNRNKHVVDYYSRLFDLGAPVLDLLLYEIRLLSFGN